MPRFIYTAYDSSGRLERGDVEAESRSAALESIARAGKYALDIEPDGGRLLPKATESKAIGPEAFGPKPIGQRPDRPSARPLPPAVLATIVRELATLLRADVPLDEALRILALQPSLRHSSRRHVAAALDRVMGGASLSDALACSGAFPEHVCQLVRAGEASGALPQVLGELAGELEQAARLRGQVVSAMLYPLVLLAAAGITLIVLVTTMVPALLPLFRDAGVEPPLLIALLAALGGGITGNWPVVLALGAVCVVGVRLASGSGPVAELHDLALLRLPVLGQLVRRGCTARIARTLAILIRNGVPMLDALRATSGVVRNRPFRASMRDTEAAVNRGEPLLGELTRSGLYPELALRLIAVGEQAGQLPAMLTRIAEIYEHEVQQQLQRLLSLTAPVVTALIGLLIGGLILSVVGSLLALNDTVLR